MRSGSGKKIWHLSEFDSEKAERIAVELNIRKTTAALLCLRGADSPDSARKFLRKETCSFYNPFLLKDMNRAVERIVNAIDNGTKVCIYGDYDVDGITATSLLCTYLREKGLDCDYYIPKRSSEGYGVNVQALDTIAESGAGLVITVDTGVTAIEETEYAKKLGLDIVITDHHECKETLPDAIVVNPCRHDCSYPYKSLAGVGVVFKLICAIEMKLAGQTDEVPTELLKEMLTKYAQIVALGTVADVMPATDENRLVISVGLSLMQKTPDRWCKAILDFYGFYGNGGKEKKQITTSTIGYILAPRINAAGRIGDAELAVKLFLSNTKAETDSYAAELCELNRKRQQMENDILEEALEMLKNEGGDDPFIVLSSDSWNQGIIGIVASRIAEKFSRPCILITFCDEDTLSGKGSGRSVNGINIFEALESCKDILTKYGGHELAAGLTLKRDKLDEFKKRLNEYTQMVTKTQPASTVINIDTEPECEEICLDSASELRMLEPFGYGNPSPLFLITDASVSDIMPLGSDKHCKFTLSKKGYSYQCVYFGVSQSQLGFCSNDTVDAVFSMEVNNYNNNEKLQLIIKDIRTSKELRSHIDRQMELYEKISSNEKILPQEIDEIIPTREDFKSVYLHIINLTSKGIDSINYCYEARRLSAMCNAEIGICKFRLILDIFREKELIDYQQTESEILKIRKSDKIAPGEKVSLDGSSVLCNLRELRNR